MGITHCFLAKLESDLILGSRLRKKTTEGKFLGDLLARFKDHLVTLGISDGSIRNYLSDLNHFQNWLGSSYPEHSFADINSEHPLAYRTYLVHELEAPVSSVNRRLSSLRQFFTWAVTQNLLSSHPMEGLSNISIRAGNTEVTPQQSQSVLAPLPISAVASVSPLGSKKPHKFPVKAAAIALLTLVVLTLASLNAPNFLSGGGITEILTVFRNPFSETTLDPETTSLQEITQNRRLDMLDKSTQELSFDQQRLEQEQQSTRDFAIGIQGEVENFDSTTENSIQNSSFELNATGAPEKWQYFNFSSGSNTLVTQDAAHTGVNVLKFSLDGIKYGGLTQSQSMTRSDSASALSVWVRGSGLSYNGLIKLGFKDDTGKYAAFQDFYLGGSFGWQRLTVSANGQDLYPAIEFRGYSTGSAYLDDWQLTGGRNQIRYAENKSSGQGSVETTGQAEISPVLGGTGSLGTTLSRFGALYLSGATIDSSGNVSISGTTTSKTIKPLADRTYDLGTSTLYYRAVYAQSIFADSTTIGGDQTILGNLTVAGTSTLIGNVSAGSNLTVSGTTTLTGLLTSNGGIITNNASINAGSGSISGGSIAGATLTTTGNTSVGGTLTVSSTINSNTFNATSLSFSGASPIITTSSLNSGISLEASGSGLINIGAVSTGDVNIAGGSGSTGCTIFNSSGDLTCTGNILGAATGTVGYWTRAGTTLSPATSGDSVTTSGNISSTGSGTITSAGLLTASNGLTLTTGALNLTSSSGAVSLTLSSSLTALNINSGLFNIDTTNSRVGIGDTAPSAKLSLGGTGTTNGIVLGDDGVDSVNLYRSAANTLKTDDDLVIGSTGNGKITVGVVDPYLITNNGTFQGALQFQTTATAGADDFIFEPLGVEKLRLSEAGNFSLSGTGTFSTATGAISLNGPTTLTGTNTLTVGTGATTLGGILSVTGAGTFSSTLGVSGLLTASGGLTVTGATNINTSGANATNIGTGTNTGTITIGNASGGDLVLSDAQWSVTGAGAAVFSSLSTGTGAITGGAGSFTSISNSGFYTQSGTSANTFTGATTLSASGTALIVTNNASIGGTLNATGVATFGSSGSFASTLTASNGLTLTTGALNLTSTSGSLSLIAGGANALLDLKADDTVRSFTLNNSGADTAAAGTPDVKLIVKGGTTQTGNLVELQNAAGTVLAKFAANGDLTLGSTGNGKITVGVVDPYLITNTGTFQSYLEFRNTATAGADDFVFTLGGTERARLTETGNLSVVGTLTAQSTSTSTFAGPVDMQNNVILNIGNAGTDFVATTGALNLAGVLTANGGITLGSSQTFSATSGIISATGLSSSTISTTSSNLTLSTTTSGTLALTSAGALNLSAGSASTFNLANVANALNFDADTLSIDALNNRVGIGNATPGTTLDVTGTGRFSTTLTASNGFTQTTGATSITGTSGSLALSGLAASSISTGANALTFTSSNFNTTATGINSTAIGATTTSTGAFTTISASGQITSTLATGTAPFVIASTTNVANLNASSLNGATFAAPGPIGSTTSSTGAFTTISASGLISANGGLTLAANQNLTLTTGTGTITQGFSSGVSGTGETKTITNTNTGATSTTVNGLGINLVGTTNANANANTITGINFGNVTTLANNAFNGLTFGTGYSNFLTSGTINISAAGAVTGATGYNGLVVTANSGVITTGTWNGTSLTDGFVSDTLTSSLFVGSGSTTTAIDLATAEVAGILPILNGGTGSSTQNFVDLTTAQTVGGAKTFSSALIAPTTVNTINSLIISSGALSGITGYTQGSGNFNLTSTSGAISATGLGASTIGTTSANLTLSTTTSGTLALNSAGALNLSAGAASTFTLANVANAFNFDSDTLSIDALNNRVGIGLNNPATKLDITGLTLNTDADNTIGVANLTNSLTKNDANTRTFSSLMVKPTFNTGASNTNTTYNVLSIDTVNTAVTGLTTNLISAAYGGTVNFKVKSNGDVVVGATGTGKLTVGTVDPLYNIDGVRYSTYAPSMLGIKEEITGDVTLSYDSANNNYSHTINLANQPQGSDLWVFARVSDPDVNMTTVLVSANSSARVWYLKDASRRSITFFSDRSTSVSFRLTAPRFDHLSWGTLSEDQETVGMTAPAQAPVGSESGSLSVNSYFGAFSENFNTTGTVTAGDLVSVDPTSSEGKLTRANGAYDARLTGVATSDGPISTVTSAGRVQVKVSVENGNITPGDHLTSSATKPGFAMKATQAGRTIGVALQPLTGSDGTVLVSVTPSWFDPTAPTYNSNGTVTPTNSSSSATYETLTATTANITNLNVGGVAIVTDESGNLKVNGNVIITGKGTFAEVRVTGLLTLIGGISAPNGLAVNLGLSKAFEIKNSAGEVAASISDQGALLARSAEVGELKVSTFSTQPTTGVTIFRAGGTSMLIETTKITSTSKVIVTFKGNYAPATRYWTSDEVSGESFTLHLDQAPSSDVSFNWWIIN